MISNNNNCVHIGARKVAVITGSSRGIGRSLAVRFAQEGYYVTVNGTSEDKVNEVVKEINQLQIQNNGTGADKSDVNSPNNEHHTSSSGLKKLPPHAIGITTSVTTKAGCDYLIEQTIQQFGHIDVLINNAGIVRDRMSYNLSQDDWEEVINVHLNGTFYCSQAFIQHVRERLTCEDVASKMSGDATSEENGDTSNVAKGETSSHSNGYTSSKSVSETGRESSEKRFFHIINMTSTSGLHGTIGQANYSAAKAGILGLTWTLAQELERFNICVNAIAPAALTDMTKPLIEKAEQHAREKGEPLPSYWEVGTPEAVAEFVMTLLKKNEANQNTLNEAPITGQVFSVNGDNIGKWNAPYYERIDSIENFANIHNNNQ